MVKKLFPSPGLIHGPIAIRTGGTYPIVVCRRGTTRFISGIRLSPVGPRALHPLVIYRHVLLHRPTAGS